MARSQSAARVEPTTPVETLFVQAVDHHQGGRLKQAETLYKRICKTQPLHAESWSNLGLVLIARHEAQEAAKACRQALSIRPAYIEAHLNLIAALEMCGCIDEVADVYRQLIPLAPKRADLWNRFGEVLIRQNRTSQAVLAFREAITVKTDFVEAYVNMAQALNSLGFIEEAIQSYRNVLALDPNHAAVCSNLGTLLGATGRFTEATAVSLHASKLMPDSPEVFCNLGVVMQRQGRVGEAVTAYQRALSLRPDYAAALGNLAAGLQEQFKFDEAALALKQAIALKPDFTTAIIDLIKIRRHICDWSEYAADHAALLQFIAEKKDAIFMLLLMCFPSSAQQQLDCARLGMRRHNEITRAITKKHRSPASAKIRIGYLSTDFRDHPVGRLVPEIFARHDRARFDVIGYALGTEDNGALRQRIRQACDQFVDLHQISDIEAAARIEADNIDILIDLTGPTVGSRLEILARRPAPLQVSFLGWPGSMGADFIDYVIGDAYITPQDQQEFYYEKIIHLPDVYQPSDLQRPIPLKKASRVEYGLPDDAFVFCSFNNPNKITPSMFALWMRLLQQVENSVLWLYCKSLQTIENLKQEAEACGIAADRIIFASVATYPVYLDRLCQADLFLDSAPYNAGATCNDALWVGLPVLTCSGETYVSRMAGSLLTAAGVPELITDSLGAYEEVALRMARDPALLNSLRQRLTEGRATSPLFDMARFTGHLERAYGEMHAIRQAGEAPRAISIASPA
jgi:predicted O-linked N-acetylglucosamine transferase (SPINDLY family)